MTAPPVGRVVATELKPSTPHQFHFWTARESPIGIGAIVRVRGGRAHGLRRRHRRLRLLRPGDADARGDRRRRRSGRRRRWSPPRAPRSGSSPRRCCGRCPRSRSSRCRSARSGWPTTPTCCSRSGWTRYTGGERPTGIPVGLYAAGGLESPVYLDCDFLLGPEAAHLNITGVSGLATKTSAVEFLLAQHLPDLPAPQGLGRGALLQREGPRPLLPRPAGGAVRGGPPALRSGSGSAPEPFADVHYYAPLQARRREPQHAAHPRGARRATPSRSSGGCARCSTTPRSCSTATTWTPRPTRSSISWRSGWSAASTRTTCCAAGRSRCRASPTWRSSSAPSSTSWRRWGRAARSGGPTTSPPSGRSATGSATSRPAPRAWSPTTAPPTTCPGARFADRSVYVVDVAGLDPLAQDLVFARVVSKLREHLERRDLGVDHVVVFVDELNKYAPGRRPRDLRAEDAARPLRARAATSAWCSSPPSSSAPRCSGGWSGNAGTGVFGRMDADELATPGYATLSPATKIKLATLPKGELMVRHPHFTQPIFVKFPRPRGPRRPRGHRALSARRASCPSPTPWRGSFASLDRRISAEAVYAAIDGRREDDVRRALARHPPRAARRTRSPTSRPASASGSPARSCCPRRGIPAVRRGDDGYGA